MTRQTMRIVPKAALGYWSIGLILAMPLLFYVGSLFLKLQYSSIQGGSTILADIAARPGLTLSMLAGMGAGIAAFITGLLVIIRHRERSLLVYASTLIGALVILFLAAEFLSPH